MGFTIQINTWKKYCVIYLLENKVFLNSSSSIT